MQTHADICKRMQTYTQRTTDQLHERKRETARGRGRGRESERESERERERARERERPAVSQFHNSACPLEKRQTNGRGARSCGQYTEGRASPLRPPAIPTCLHTSAYVSIRRHTSAYVSIRQHTSAYVSIRQQTSAYVRIRQHTSADVSWQGSDHI